MNFYEHQDRARRRTGLLVALFLLAVAIIVLAVNAVGLLAASSSQDAAQNWQAWLASPYGWWTTGSVLGLIGAGTGYTSLRLAGGGKALAKMVGARPLRAASDDKDRQLRNVVEEMSIAAGTPQPTLYVLDNETAINAFVAGTRPTQTMMIVTRGALDAFTRDELQGVVAHEYSHIFHEDMHVNMRLMGMLAGILLISRMGRGLMRVGGNSGEKRGGQAALLGFALFAIGELACWAPSSRLPLRASASSSPMRRRCNSRAIPTASPARFIESVTAVVRACNRPMPLTLGISVSAQRRGQVWSPVSLRTRTWLRGSRRLRLDLCH